MKRVFIYPLLIGLVYLTGCSKSTPVQTIPIPTPTGTFGGRFQLVHTTVKTGVNDTVGCNLTLVLSSNGDFTITGDTSTYHAGSKGKYILGIGNDLVFTDSTAPGPANSKKSHLNGDLRYQYNGSILGLDKNVGDSLSYQYYFTKSSN